MFCRLFNAGFRAVNECLRRAGADNYVWVKASNYLDISPDGGLQDARGNGSKIIAVFEGKVRSIE